MRRLHDHEFLSWGDALFLYLERPGMPLNVASVNVFEGVIPLADCIDFIESKLPLIPRYWQRVVNPPFDIGLPSWEFDPEFDVRNHVREVTLKRGTEAEFKRMAGKLLSVNLDRSHPLWDMILVRGLKGQGTGVVMRVHHCLADGIAGVGLMNVIMDANPAPPPLPKKKLRLRRPRNAGTLLIDGLIGAYFSTVQRVLRMESEVLDIARKVAAGVQNGSISELLGFMPELSAPTERLPFNVNCHGPQKFAWVEIPLDDIKAIRHATGTTVNDVILTLVASAFSRYAELHGVNPRRRLLRIVVPVNMRGDGRPGDLGNRISFLPVTIPFGIRNPRRLLMAVQRRMELLKSAHVAEFVSLAGTLLGAIPTTMQALAGPVASQLPISLCNLICTNVPGPQVPLYLLGHKMLRWYPYVPIGGEMGINCAILTYNGMAYFGFTGDVQAAPDLGRLEKFVTISFGELQKTAGIRPPVRPKRAPAKKRVAPAAQPAAVQEREVAFAMSA